MAIEISSKQIEPIRQTYDQVEQRIGKGKAASRYQEATFDVQPTQNFHYPSSYDPEYELFDPSRTAIKMEDWYAFLDPRQYYYSAYTIARAKQQEVAEKNFSFVESKELFSALSEDVLQKIRRVFVPLRHVEWAGNMNNCAITDIGYGTAITQAALFHGFDKLGVAQYLTRISLIIEGNSEDGLDAAKTAWMDDPIWQPLRHAVEDMLVLKDWFELLVAQNIVLDGLLYPLVYGSIVDDLTSRGAVPLAMLTEFMREWQKEAERWTSAVTKAVCKESPENELQVREWASHWLDRFSTALIPIAAAAFEGPQELHRKKSRSLFSSSKSTDRPSQSPRAEAEVAEVRERLITRLSKQGLKLSEAG